MNDVERKQIARTLGPINAKAAKNKVETDYEKVKDQLHAFYEEVKQRLDTFIVQQRIKPHDLPSYKIREVVVDCDCMTIITPSGQYVHVSAESGYGGSVDFSTSGHPDIEDAHAMGILSKEQYDEYKTAQQAYLEQSRKIDARNRMMRLVRDAGAATVQEYLNGLDQ